ncbi:hypothetical protein [Streptomyces sp. CT34]|uniref:hypothetical protein n=1 Tax=Streptomyces sp. CT34 TaxID=1553907 RepID=UPI0018E3EEC8|nr:hypothetical protein [Streptomyces sp. CT34]
MRQMLCQASKKLCHVGTNKRTVRVGDLAIHPGIRVFGMKSLIMQDTVGGRPCRTSNST